MKRSRSTTAFILCIIMLTTLFAGCAGEDKNAQAPEAAGQEEKNSSKPSKKGKTPVGDGKKETLSMGANLNFEDLDKDWWPSEFVAFIEDKLNINFKIVEYDADTLNLALAGGDLPDLLMVNDSQPILDGKQAVPMDDYLEEYGSNIKKFTIRNEMIRKYLSNGDGKLYFHTPNTGPEDITGGTEIWNGYLVRWDLYKEIGAPKIKSDDDYIEILKKMKKLYPATENGEPVYAMGIHNDGGLWGWCMRAIANKGFSNIGNSWSYVVNTNTNEIYHNFLDTENGPFWDNMEFYNRLFNEGLLDPDSFTMKAEQVNEKAAKGQYIGGYCTWYTGKLYETEREKDPNTLKGIVSIPVEGMNGWYGQDALVGWSDKLLFITNKCKNVPLAVKFIDFFDSDEANRAHYSGIQGKHWDYNAEGVPEVFPETIALRTAGGEEWNKTGIGSFANFVGASGFGKHSDGQYFNLFDDPEVKSQTLSPLAKDFSKFYGVEYPSQAHYKMVQEGRATNQQKALHQTIMMGVNAVPGDLARIDSQSEEIVTRAIPSLVQAKDTAKFSQLQSKVIADLKKANAQESWDWWQKQWNSSKAYVESILKK